MHYCKVFLCVINAVFLSVCLSVSLSVCRYIKIQTLDVIISVETLHECYSALRKNV